MTAQQLGARFYKADLHTHSPGSSDFGDKGVSAAALIDNAIAKGIEVLAVTDHNSASWVDQLRAAAKGKPIWLIPGVEITTPEGHILALFDTHYSATAISDLLLRIGMPREKHGKEEAISTSHAEDVVEAITEADGLAIAAHANDSSGLLKSKGQYSMKVVPMKELAALELTKQDEIGRWCAGKVSKDYPKKACVQGSDAHTLADVGRRITFLKMDAPSLRGIRQALLDYEVRVRFPWDYKVCSHPRVLSLLVDQGFFGGQTFAFHESLNCLVGGKGTGKSTVVELLRYCFNDTSEITFIREDHEGKVRSLVGDGGVVVVEYLDSDGETKTVRREVQPWETEREVRDSAGNPGEIETPPVFFSQGELVSIAASPLAQLELIDRRVDLAEEDRKEGELLQKLRENARSLIGAEARILGLRAEVSDREKGKAATEARHNGLGQKLDDPILKEFPLWEAEQQHLADLDRSLVELGDAFDAAIEEVDLAAIVVKPADGSPNAATLMQIDDLHEKAEKALRGAGLQFKKVIGDLRARVKQVGKEIAPRFIQAKGNHTKVAQALGTTDVRQANAQYRNLGKRLEELRKHEQELTKHEKAVDELRKKRKEMITRLAEVRHRRWEKRSAKGKELEGALGGIMTIGVTEAGDRKAYEEGIKSLSRQGRLQEADIRLIAAHERPSDLVDHVLAHDADGIARECGVSKEVAGRLVDAFLKKDPEEVYELECAPLPDRPEITYSVAPGRAKPLHELSTGGKGTVIISVAMVEGVGPLVVDQPEEPLDTQSIYGQVVRTLRASKDTRQFILTTHNPNVAVGADAELSHILEATADKGTIQSSGAVDHAGTNRLLLQHLEGGEEALRLRIRKYEL